MSSKKPPGPPGGNGADDKKAGKDDDGGGAGAAAGGDAAAKPGSAGATTRDAALRLLAMCQKGEWPPVDQALKSLEKAVAAAQAAATAGEDPPHLPFIGLADPVRGQGPRPAGGLTRANAPFGCNGPPPRSPASGTWSAYRVRRVPRVSGSAR